MAASDTSSVDVLEHAGEIALEFVATKLALINLVEDVGRTTPIPDLEPMFAWAGVVLGDQRLDLADDDLMNRASEIEGVMWRAVARFCELRAEMTVGSGRAASHA